MKKRNALSKKERERIIFLVNCLTYNKANEFISYLQEIANKK